jgi:hypothetical protein
MVILHIQHMNTSYVNLAHVILSVFKNLTYIVNHIFKISYLYIDLVMFEYILS